MNLVWVCYLLILSPHDKFLATLLVAKGFEELLELFNNGTHNILKSVRLNKINKNSLLTFGNKLGVQFITKLHAKLD